MTHSVRCPRCRFLSRVGPADLGRLVVCPRCQHQFAAAPADDPAEPPTVHPAPDPPTHQVLDPVTVGLALLSWGIPLGWLVALLLTGREPVFSFVAPVAVAAGLTGLGFGAACARWSPATRVKAVVALLMIGYVTAGALFVLKREWAEAVRHHLGRGPQDWVPFDPPHKGYKVEVPGRAAEAASPLPGWELKAFQVADPRWRSDLFVVASGPVPGDLPADESWIERAKQAVAAGAAGGELRADPAAVEAESVARKNGKPEAVYPGREFVVDLPGQTVRIVRVFRDRDRAFYLAAQGPFWRPDTRDVQRFFRSFKVGAK